MLKKLLLCMLALMMTLSLMLTGCGSKKEKEESTTKVEGTKETGDTNTGADQEEAGDSKEELEHVNLTYYFANSPVEDLARVSGLANEIIKEKINATVEYKLLDWSQYAQKLNLMISSGEPFDMAFCGSWGDMNYFQNAGNGAFLPLDDLLDKYAPVSKSRVPEQIWDGVKVNGNIYGVVNYQVWGMANAKGVQLRQDLVDEFGFDWKSVKKWEDITPYLAKVKENYPEMIGFEYARDVDNFAGLPTVYGMDAVGDTKSVGWVKIDDDKVEVINQYKTDEYKEYLKVFRDWYTKGYIKKDAATQKDITADRKSNKVAAIYANAIPDMVDMPELATFTMMSMSPDKKSYGRRFTEPFISASAPSATVTTIGANSKNPERAMMYIELMNTDDFLFNTVAWGEEGVDYERISDKQINVPDDAPYKFNWSEWQMGQSYGRIWWDQNVDVEMREKSLGMIYEYDKTAKASPVIGFVFDSEPVKTEVANCNTVLDKYLAALGSGTVDPEKELSKFLDALDKAGAEKIIEEKQKQINEWLKSNSK